MLDLMSFSKENRETSLEKKNWSFVRSPENIFIMVLLFGLQERDDDKIPFSQHGMILYIVLMLVILTGL